MRRVVFALSFASLVAFAGSRSTLGQTRGNGNPFIDHSDTGETVHVLPAQAAIHSPHDTQPTDAPDNGISVFPASYGSGSLVNHGGHQIPDAGFVQIYWNSSVANATATSLGYSNIHSQINGFVNAFSGTAAYTQTDRTADYTVIQQYGVSDPISFTLSNAGTYTDTKATQSSVSDSKIRSYIAGLLGTKVTFDPDFIYGVYFPPGMKITLQGGTSCSSFCGYHGHFLYLGQEVKYAV